MSDDVKLLGSVLNPYTTSVGDGLENELALGRNSEVLVSEVHGKWANAAARGVLFTFNVTAVTVPVVAATLVSVFSLYNPVGSGRNLELVDFDCSMVLATTVVDTIGLYTSNPVLAAKGTFTTAGAPLSGMIGSTAAGVGIPYSAYTHSGTPIRYRILGGFGATTDATSGMIHYEFDGRSIIPPGAIVSVAMSTAAGTTSGLDLGISWIETMIT